jgi:chromosome segregation ATPase
LKEALDIKSHEAELLAARLQQCEHSRMIEEIEAAREQVIQSREALKAAAQKEADADAKAKQIESAMSKSSGTVPPLSIFDKHTIRLTDCRLTGRSQKDEMKVIHEKMVTTKASLGDATKSIKQHDEKIEQAELELEQLKKEQNELLEKIRECESEIKKLQKELHAMEHGKGGVAEKRAAYEAAQERLQKKQESVLSTDEGIAGLLQEKDDRTQASIEREQKLKKLQNKVKRFHKDKEDAKKYCVRYSPHARAHNTSEQALTSWSLDVIRLKRRSRTISS